MAASTVTITGGGGTEQLLAADGHRDFALIQLQSAHPTYLGFGEDAVASTGIALLYAGCSIEVTGHKARGVINAIAAGNAIIGMETFHGIKYGSGDAAGP